MTASAPQVIQVSCPNCRTPLRVQLVTFVDVGHQPELKNYLLAGQLNRVDCPSCGTPAMISAPLIYHDPAKQLFLIHFPQQLNARAEDQERFIGDATSAIMRSLPPDAPRGYLLAPRRFLTISSLVETVLEADGISREMIEAQRLWMELISRLMEAYEQGEEQLAKVVEENKTALDYEFFATLTAFIQASSQTARDESAQLMLGLRDKLLELTGFDVSKLGVVEEEEFPLDEALERLTNVADAELEQAVAELRPTIDYSFFSAWTERIDMAERAGDRATADRLTTRRAQILELTERMDKQAQELLEAGANFLKELMEAPDPEVLLRANTDRIDESFLLLLDANRAAAARAQNSRAVEQLTEIKRLAAAIVQESLPPEDRFINELLQSETAQAATNLLRQNAGTITPALIKRMNELADQLENDGRKPLGERLRQLGREAGAMLF